MNKEGNRYFLRGKAASNAQVILCAKCLLVGSAPKPLKTRAKLCGYNGFLRHPSFELTHKKKEAPVLTDGLFSHFVSGTGQLLPIQAFFPVQILSFWQEVPRKNVEIVFDVIQRCEPWFQFFECSIVTFFLSAQRIVFSSEFFQ